MIYTDIGADISESGLHRYRLWREWDTDEDSLANPPYVLFVMLNPSTADSSQDDPTIRRCIGFAKSFGYKRLEVVNLWAWRATKPADLFKSIKVNGYLPTVGPSNARLIKEAATAADKVILAWGIHGNREGRSELVRPWLTERVARGKCFHLGLADNGEPRHPLFVPASTKLVNAGSSN